MDPIKSSSDLRFEVRLIQIVAIIQLLIFSFSAGILVFSDQPFNLSLVTLAIFSLSIAFLSVIIFYFRFNSLPVVKKKNSLLKQRRALEKRISRNDLESIKLRAENALLENDRKEVEARDRLQELNQELAVLKFRLFPYGQVTLLGRVRETFKASFPSTTLPGFVPLIII